jgi:thiol-disulfide isomerase/thioredoxin
MSALPAPSALQLCLPLALLAASCAGSRPGSAREVRLATLDGKPFELKQLQGRVVLLDFWATWCEPCRATLPVAQRLSDRYAARGLSAYAVNVERKLEGVPRFLEELHVDLPVLNDPGGDQAEALGGANLPFAVLLDRGGAVRFRSEGAREDTEEKLAAEVDKLLAEAPPSAQ